ncbi:hypothetical protein DL95DRAFT_471121 [Leptodontidium sp. 2 PMI_412]|nr:hypothetical protein DL95DRAFT_471121 [Leptodontidium sp. 2 PMI_412]
MFRSAETKGWINLHNHNSVTTRNMSDYYAGVNFTKKIHSDTYPYISAIAVPTSYNGKVIFITGASRGIGRAAALSYARSGAGGLALAARTSSALASLETEINSISPCTKCNNH